MNNYRDRSHFMNARQLPPLSTAVDDVPTYAESVIVGGFSDIDSQSIKD